MAARPSIPSLCQRRCRILGRESRGWREKKRLTATSALPGNTTCPSASSFALRDAFYRRRPHGAAMGGEGKEGIGRVYGAAEAAGRSIIVL